MIFHNNPCPEGTQTVIKEDPYVNKSMQHFSITAPVPRGYQLMQEYFQKFMENEIKRQLYFGAKN